MNNIYKKECIQCSNYSVSSDECSIIGKCTFSRLIVKKRVMYRRKSKDFYRDLLGNKVD
jgi:hypothetical protein